MQKNIVIVEDERDTGEMFAEMLRLRGYLAHNAFAGTAALSLIAEKQPDVILLDLMMPDMDGWDVYHQLKANEQLKNIPVIIITAKSQEIDRVLGLHIAKVDDYICKPFHPQELLDSMDRVFTRLKTS